MTHSLALISDALHVIFHLPVIVVAIVVAYLLRKNYNQHKLESWGTGIIATMILGTSVWIIVAACYRFSNAYIVQTATMLVVAIIGLIGNFVQLKILKDKDNHSTTHSLINWHFLFDLISSVVLIMAAVIIQFFHGSPIIDPIASIIIAICMALLPIQSLWNLIFKKEITHHH